MPTPPLCTPRTRTIRRWRRTALAPALVAALLAALALSACATQRSKPPSAVSDTAPAIPAEDLSARYQQRRQAGQNLYVADPGASRIRIYAFRGGKAPQLGHNHVFSIQSFEGYASLDGELADHASFDLRFALEDLRADDPAWREETGGAFSGARSESDIAGTLRNMLGPKNLDAAQFPELRIHAVEVGGDWPILVARIAVSLHGQTREQDLMLHVARAETTLKASGSFVLRQSDFGATPFSVFGGLLAVQDPVAIEFDLLLRRQ